MKSGYGQFCPIAMASEILCTRWSPLLMRELLCGSTRFNDLRRGVPRMSPTLLSRRLKEFEAAGVITSVPGKGGTKEYHLTPAGEELRPLVMGLGAWGQRWVESNLSLDNLDPQLLIWDMHRWLKVDAFPDRLVCIQFIFLDFPPLEQNYWLLANPETGAEACYNDPGHEVDLFVECDLRVMTKIWMGLSTVKSALNEGGMELIGDQTIAANMPTWLGLSPFAQVERVVS